MHNNGSSGQAGPSRRDILLLGAGAFAVAAVPLWRSRRRNLIRRSVPSMGTIAEIGVVHRDEHYAQGAIDAAFARLRQVERLMTRFEATSDVGRANLRAAAEPVGISQATANVVQAGLLWAESSDGAFDPCLGKVSEIWSIGSRTTPPRAEQVHQYASRNLYRTLDIDSWNGRPVLRFAEPDVEIDLGGIAKGYGVDSSVQVLREWGITDALVNVGGDLYAMGSSEDGDPWVVGVRSPQDPGKVSGQFEISDAAVATSGDYMRFFRYNGRQYHHLMDPKTAEPRESSVHSITITADDCLTADAAATTVFGMANAKAHSLLSVRAPRARIVSTI
ncbi:FAD:protein FMN transferase [Gemmatimonadota bacterium]